MNPPRRRSDWRKWAPARHSQGCSEARVGPFLNDDGDDEHEGASSGLLGCLLDVLETLQKSQRFETWGGRLPLDGKETIIFRELQAQRG